MSTRIKPHKLFPIALVIYEMIAYLANDMYLPALPQIRHDLAITTHAAQLTLTMWFLGFASSSLILGPLSDRWGRRPILFIHGYIFLLATLLCSLTSNLLSFLIARFFQGSVVCSITTAGYSSIHESYDSLDAIKILALMGSIIILGPAFGPLVGSAILAALNWRWIFIFLFLSGSAALASLWFVMPKNYLAANRKPLALKVISKNYLTILMNPQFILNLLVFCLAYLAMIAWIVLGPFLVIQHFQYKTSSFSLLQALIFSAMIIATWLIKYFSEKIGIHRLVKTGLVIALAASVFAIILTSIFPANLLALVLPLSSFILGSSLAFFPLQRVAIESCHEPMGARMAILSSLMSLFAVIGSFIISHAFTGSLLWFAGLLLSLSLASIFSYSFSRYLHAVNEKKRNLFK